ncbi:MAG TPA: hypothetical protein DD435_05840 [Cyanobacteria bacterium UBA8530]|nr:hypothetical protein [Cyanobacteria bacterium UBA8530]
MDQALFDRLVDRLKSGALSGRTNLVAGNLEPPGSIPVLPPTGHPERLRLEEKGKEACRRKQLGAVILAGGMATRFDFDQPKGLFPILDGKSFLQLKLESIQRDCPAIPIHIMTSFHTDEAIRRNLSEKDYFGIDPEKIRIFRQNRFPRLKKNEEISLCLDEKGEIDYAAPGHGDFAECLRRNSLLRRFLAEGGKYLLFSNVDNLGATVDFAIIGWHIESGRPMTVEVAAKAPGDKGGAPARVEGRLRLVEGFSFPESFDQEKIEVFNTASYVFSGEALDREFDLPWYVVEKQVKEEKILQLEHLAGDLSIFLDAGFLLVEREQRFLPVKSLEDVPAVQKILRRKLAL